MGFSELLSDLVIGLELVKELTMLIMLDGRMENLVILMNRIFSLAANVIQLCAGRDSMGKSVKMHEPTSGVGCSNLQQYPTCI